MIAVIISRLAALRFCLDYLNARCMRISTVSVMICSEIILSSELNFIENARGNVQHDEFVDTAYLTGIASA